MLANVSPILDSKKLCTSVRKLNVVQLTATTLAKIRGDGIGIIKRIAVL